MAEAAPQIRTELKCNSSVSFSHSQRPSQQMNGEDDDIQIALAPYIQNYLAQNGQRPGCCGFYLPIPFQRAASHSWWDSHFVSEILEDQYRRSSFPQVQLRFQYVPCFII